MNTLVELSAGVIPPLFIAMSLLGVPGVANAQSGLQATAVAYPGGFETNDPGTTSHCNNGNVLTGVCTCAGNLPSAIRFRVISDAQGLWGSWAHFCASGNPTSVSEFAGGYQVDDPVPGGVGCKVANANTGNCSCPAGTVGVPVRALTDSSAGIIGSVLVICQRQTGTPVAFGGAFQRDDAGGCRSANPNTGACSCPAGFIQQTQRLIVDGPFGAHLFTCVPPLSPVQICPGVWADPSGSADTAAALRQCVTQFATVDLPAGTYRVDSQLLIDRQTTLRTQATAGSGARCLYGTSCAAITAGPNFYQEHGFVRVANAEQAVLDHIILDGNRGGRINSSAAHSCRGGSNRFGFNATYYRCTRCGFTNSASINALCGTALEWFGDYAGISNSLFVDNGDEGLWADGLTILRSDGASVTDNVFRENTDIGFIFGGGNHAVVAYNSVENRSRFAFAGLMMDNFGVTSVEGLPMGSFYGTTYWGNWVECDRCSFAMNVGPYPWYGGPRIYYGTLVNNVFRGGHITLNVDGSGADPYSGITVLNNNVGPNIPQNIYCMQTALFNLSYTDSFLHPSSTLVPTSYQNTFRCHR